MKSYELACNRALEPVENFSLEHILSGSHLQETSVALVASMCPARRKMGYITRGFVNEIKAEAEQLLDASSRTTLLLHRCLRTG